MVYILARLLQAARKALIPPLRPSPGSPQLWLSRPWIVIGRSAPCSCCGGLDAAEPRWVASTARPDRTPILSRHGSHLRPPATPAAAPCASLLTTEPPERPDPEHASAVILPGDRATRPKPSSRTQQPPMRLTWAEAMATSGARAADDGLRAGGRRLCRSPPCLRLASRASLRGACTLFPSEAPEAPSGSSGLPVAKRLQASPRKRSAAAHGPPAPWTPRRPGVPPAPLRRRSERVLPAATDDFRQSRAA